MRQRIGRMLRKLGVLAPVPPPPARVPPPPPWTSYIALNPEIEILPPLAPACEHPRDISHAPGLAPLLARADFEELLSHDNWPLPATADREYYHEDRHFETWLSGLRDYLFVKSQADRCGVTMGKGTAVLDFGCATGRIMRHFLAHEPDTAVFGCDINRNHVLWMREYFPQRLIAFQNTILPTLALPDASIDVLYAYSVFTHIDQFEDTWLMELRRVVRPGGVLVLTIHSDRTWGSIKPEDPVYWGLEIMKDTRNELVVSPELFKQPMPRDRIVFVTEGRVYNTNVFHTTAYIHRHWGRLFEVVDIVPEVNSYQDGVILRKR